MFTKIKVMEGVIVKIKKIVLLCILFVLISSCVSNKTIAYFQFDKIDESEVSNSYQTIFKPGDLLQITISAQDMEAVKPFNLSGSSVSGAGGGASEVKSYLVDNSGEIDFPVIGKLKLGGMSKTNALKLIKNKISPDFVKNPTINIRISNFKVTVYGDVNSPGVFNIPNERVSIIEAIGLAGDLTLSGKRDNVLLIREENGKKVKYNINLLSNKTLSSPEFYLQQNDVVYVEHNNFAIQSASSNANMGLYFSVGSILITLITILTR
jgi:polysaccharide export outer membrane protein